MFHVGTTGGTGGGGEVDARCVTFKAEATKKVPPSDIIIAVDQSGSMAMETKWVREQLNGFPKQIMDANIDVHVVLIADKPGGQSITNSICVPPPLASGGCGDNPLVFTHIDQVVDSTDALEIILNRYSDYEHALRPEAYKHIIVISDDNSNQWAPPAKRRRAGTRACTISAEASGSGRIHALEILEVQTTAVCAGAPSRTTSPTTTCAATTAATSPAATTPSPATSGSVVVRPDSCVGKCVYVMF